MDKFIAMLPLLSMIIGTIAGVTIWAVARENAKGINNEGRREIKELREKAEDNGRKIDKLENKVDNLTELLIRKK